MLSYVARVYRKFERVTPGDWIGVWCNRKVYGVGGKSRESFTLVKVDNTPGW